MNTKTKPSPYTTGQRVEVLCHDFTRRDYPRVWLPATVTAVEPRDGGLWDVMVKTDTGQLQPQIVGKRGGNKNVRAL